MRCEVHIPPEFASLLLQLRTLPAPIREHIVSTLASNNNASVAPFEEDDEKGTSPLQNEV
jgi:hypothetical protein